MNKTIFLFFLAFAFIRCKNQPQEAAKTAELAAKTNDSTDLAFAPFWKNKYPQDIKILDEKSSLNQRIRRLLGNNDAYGAFAERTAVQTPIEWENEVMFFTACAPHACTYDEIAVCFDKKSDKLWVVIRFEGDLKLYTEADDSKNRPKPLASYIEEK